MSIKSRYQHLTRNKFVKFGIEATILIALVLAISAWQARNMLDSDGTEGIPNMQLVTMQGEVESLTQPDRRTLVYFWAPWCSVCSISIGSLENVDTEELDIVTIAMDFENIEAVQAFVDKHEVTSKVMLGNEELKRLFQIHGYPSYYLLDDEANVVAKSFGLNTSIGIKLKNWLSQI